MRPDLLRFALALALVVGSALFPSTASRAGLGTMFKANPCAETTDVTAAYQFQSSFVGLAKCESLCRKAAASCKNAMNAAISCQLAFAKDWVAFDSAVDCDGLKGGQLRDCRNGWAADLKVWQSQIKAIRDGFFGLAACDSLLNDATTGCLRKCSGV